MKFGECVKKVVLIMTVLGLFYAGITSVLGVQGATLIQAGAGSRANFPATSSQSTPVQAGNVTELNISGTAITDHWAGFFGEITGDITLQTSDGSVFYNWSGLNSISGEVFASSDNAVSWAGIGCIDGTEIAALETALGILSTDADRVNQTYTASIHPGFAVAGTSLSGCNSTNAYISSGQDATSFYQVLLSDSEGDAVYTTLINESTTGFDGRAHDFQLLVGESDLVETTDLYFYMELN